MEENKEKIIQALEKKSRSMPDLYKLLPDMSKRNIRELLKEMVEIDKSISFFMSGSSTYYIILKQETEQGD